MADKITRAHLSTSDQHREIYKEVCWRRGFTAIGDGDRVKQLGLTWSDFDLWRYGTAVWKRATTVQFQNQFIPAQKDEIEFEFIGVYDALEYLEDFTNVLCALRSRIPNVPFVEWNMYDTDVITTLIDMQPVGWFHWVWMPPMIEINPKGYATGIHFQHESDAVAFVGLTSNG